jgi:hypothetical protein
MDAKIWASEFVRTIKSEELDIRIDEPFMTTWFANAIMTGFDFKSKRTNNALEKKIEKLKRLLLLTDPSVSDQHMNELSAKQWQVFINEFPDEQ